MMTDPQTQPNRQWWTQQWLDLINAYRFKKRLERGWQYAREGNVLSIRFKGEKVLAKVQGTDPEPYRVSLWLDPLTDEDWGYVIETLTQRAIFSAKLLAGEMPHNIEEVFSANGLRLFPFQLADVRSRCSCPDKANPCKHISAVYYLMGDRFTEDPFVLFQLRGRTREQILKTIREKRQSTLNPELRSRSVSSEETPNSEPRSRSVSEGETPNPVRVASPKEKLRTPNSEPRTPNSELSKSFWLYNAQLDPSLVVIAPSPDQATPIDILGSPPLTTLGYDNPEEAQSQQTQLTAYLQEVYQTVSQRAMLQAMVQG
jgi:uncharacterized Zn finger protein